MKLLHVPFTFHPDSCGGTEVYVEALCDGLRGLGCQNVIAAPGTRSESSSWRGFPVHRFTVSPSLSLDDLYGGGDLGAAKAFDSVLEAVKPDLVHFHAFSPAVSVRCLNACQARSIPAITTYHTPTQSCPRGTLMRWGRSPCDGELRTQRCSACLLNHHGVPEWPARCLAFTSRLTQALAAFDKAPNRLRLGLAASRYVSRRLQATQTWWQGMQRIISLCDWTQKLLLRNGVPASKIVQVRHGLPFAETRFRSDGPPPSNSPAPESALPDQERPVRLAFLGRLDPTKGIDLIIEALRQIPNTPLTLDLFALVQSNDRPAARQLQGKASNDARIRIRKPVPSETVVATLRSYDALVVPSRGKETGPLVVLEAFAAGIPVIGSNLGGIVEWVENESNGLLVQPSTANAWAGALARLTEDRGLLKKLQSGVRTPRTMRDVAADMHRIYHDVLEETMYPIVGNTTPLST